MRIENYKTYIDGEKLIEEYTLVLDAEIKYIKIDLCIPKERIENE